MTMAKLARALPVRSVCREIGPTMQCRPSMARITRAAISAASIGPRLLARDLETLGTMTLMSKGQGKDTLGLVRIRHVTKATGLICISNVRKNNSACLCSHRCEARCLHLTSRRSCSIALTTARAIASAISNVCSSAFRRAASDSLRQERCSAAVISHGGDRASASSHARKNAAIGRRRHRLVASEFEYGAGSIVRLPALRLQ